MNKTKVEFRNTIEEICELLEDRTVIINKEKDDTFYVIFYNSDYYVKIMELNETNVTVATFVGGVEINSYSMGYEGLSVDVISRILNYVKFHYPPTTKTVLLNSDIVRIFPMYENMMVEDKDGGQYYITHEEITKAVKRHCNFVIEKKRKRSWLTAGLPK